MPPVVTLNAPTAGASVSGTVTVSAGVTAQVNVSKVEFFVNGTTSLGVVTTAPYSVQWDTRTLANGAATIKAVATDTDAHVGTSTNLSLTVANAVAVTVTLSQLQTQVFTPKCAICHTGTAPASGPLPASQNLTAGNSYANLVGVSSAEVPTLLRVKPGDPVNSYLIQKLEGSAGIVGSRMPQGGPFLDQPSIDLIKAWITAGAPNN
jgi:mono/diheme cytochrome c family protein